MRAVQGRIGRAAMPLAFELMGATPSGARVPARVLDPRPNEGGRAAGRLAGTLSFRHVRIQPDDFGDEARAFDLVSTG